MRRLALRVCGAGAMLALLMGCSANPYQPERKFSEVSQQRLVQLAGSRIPRLVDINDPNPTTISPVTVITRDEIDARGAGDLSDFLGFFSYDFSGGQR